ncbi:HDA1 complex subunit [Aspergillus luchuensis]|uniref:HDA1 complex subunit n=1 Tax=Aspergillus kawachii TaxID=1069201 RepID=A0A146FRY3_ASPKA|nr:HDA1 complex subunit [Aspergillus luchuensis]
MSRKRKSSSTIYTSHTSHKRKKRWRTQHVVHSSDNEADTDSEALSADEWLINCILDETESQYLIDWEGPWTPTWEPKENANDVAVRVWEDKKRRDQAQEEFVRSNTPPLPSPSPPPVSSVQEHSRDSLSPRPSQPQTEAPTDESRSRQSSTPPLFVPPSPVPETTLFLDDQAGGLLRSSGIDTEVPSHTSQSVTDSPLDPEVVPTARVTEVAAIISTPCEPIVSDEVKETPTTPYRSGNTDTPNVTEGIPETPHNESSAAPSTSNLTALLPANPAEEADEIPETPCDPVDEPQLFRPASTVPESIAVNGPQTPASQLSASSFRSLLNQLFHSRSRNSMDSQEKEGPSLSDTMEKYSQFEGSTPREKLRNAYAQLRAKANPGPESSATPSSAGDIEPSVPISVPETTAPLSVRVDKEPTHPKDVEVDQDTTIPPVEPLEMGPPQTIQPSALSMHFAEEPTPGSVHLGPSEFAVPLPMDSRVKDDYERVLTSESQSIRDFLGDYQRDLLVPKMHEILDRLSNISTHPDLNIAEHIKDSESDLGREAAWAEYSSAKFLLLSYLLESASMRDIHLVIMVQGEKTQRVVERYLMGKGLSYTRPRQEMGSGTNIEVSMVKDSLSFGIQTTRNEGVMETYKAPAAIIALDKSFSSQTPTVEHMRTTFARNGNLLPVVRLLVSNSSEHIELCFSGLPEPERLKTLLQYSIRLRDVVGDLQDDALGVQEDAEELLTCLVSDNFNAHWSLPHIEPLHILSPEQLEASQQELHSRPGVDIQLTTSQAHKRAFEDDEVEQSAKRTKTEEPTQEPTQSTESTGFPSQPLNGGLQALEKNIVQMQNSHAAELEKLQKALAGAQARLQERENVLEKLQHRYETRTRDFHKLRREHDRLTQAKATSDQRVEKQKEELMKLKDERTQLRHELEEARESLKAGGGSAAELESAREDIRRLTKDNASLERKAEYEARQAEYTREQYQTASTVAAQSGNELRQLRSENETLKRKVEGDAAHLRELNTKNDEARHLARVLELEATLTSREDLLRRKEEELREIRKNRPSTRSTSTQPRSPKWTAGNSRPTSPGINNGSSLAGRGSALRFSSEMPL